MHHHHSLCARAMQLSSELNFASQETNFRIAAEVEQLAIKAQELDALLKVILIRVHDQRIPPYDPGAAMIDKLRDNAVVSDHKIKMDEWVQRANARRNRAYQQRLSA
jgi:hypothetical protein